MSAWLKILGLVCCVAVAITGCEAVELTNRANSAGDMARGILHMRAENALLWTLLLLAVASLLFGVAHLIDLARDRASGAHR